MEIDLFEYDTIDSTNNEARRLIKAGVIKSKVSLITSISQTSGRGRYLHTWQSINGNIFMTAILLKDLVLSADNLSFDVARAIKLSFGSAGNIIEFKHPNDCLINGAKFAGILIEDEQPFYIIGVGVNTVDYPREGLEYQATCLAEHNLTVTPKKILDAILVVLSEYH